MPGRRTNPTGRKRITSADVSIKLRDDLTPPAFEVPTLSLERHNLAEDARVHIEAYRQTQWMRFDFGTAGQIVYPPDLTLSEFGPPQGILFRVKVTAASAPHGQLLAGADRVRPELTEGEAAESLLPVKPDSTLGDEIFRVDFTDQPILLVNDKLGQWKEAAAEPIFVSLVYPSVLREILTRILILDRGTDDDDTDSWRNLWLALARRHPGVGSCPEDSGDVEGRAEWIDSVVSAFCKEKGIYARFSGNRPNGGDL